MFYLQIFLILIAFSFAYYSASLMSVPTTSGMDEQLADWVSFFIMDRESFILTFLILLLIFFLSNKPSKYMFNIISTGSSLFSWDKVKAIILLILIINLFFYLFMIYSWYLLFPFLSFLIIKVTLHN